MSKYTMPTAGASGHRDLKYAIEKKEETTKTDLAAKAYHHEQESTTVAKRLAPNQVLAPRWPQLQYAIVPQAEDGFELVFKRNGVDVGRVDLKRLQGSRTTVPVDFHCVTGWSTLGIRFEGLKLEDWLDALCGIDWRSVLNVGRASRIFTECLDSFTGSLDWSEYGNCWIVTHAYGEPLEPKHGFPVRLVIPTKYGFKSAKWIHTIDIIDEDKLGFWEIRGYDDSADPWLEERFAGKTGKDGLTFAQRAKHDLKKDKRPS